MYLVVKNKTTYLTGSSDAFSFELHALDALEVDDVSQVHSRALQPPVRQKSWRATVDFFALGLLSRPLFVLSTCSGGVTNHHEPVLTSVGDDGLVGQGGVVRLSVNRGVREATLDGNTGRKLRGCPGPVLLAVPGVFAH